MRLWLCEEKLIELARVLLNGLFTHQAHTVVGRTEQVDLVDLAIETELSELLPRKIYDRPTQSFGMMMRGMANGTMANESIVREALHMPILCKDIEVFDKDGRTKRRKGSSIKSTDILMPASQRTMFFTPSVSVPRKAQSDADD